MAQILKGDTFANGQQANAARLNQLVDSAVVLVGAITEQSAMAANSVEATDETIISDGGVLKKVQIGSILQSNLPVKASSITGNGGVDLVITPASGQKADVAGPLEADSINSVGNAIVGGTLNVTGATTLGSASATSLTIGGKTPMTTQDNLTKIYIKSGVASGATGAGVDNIVYQTPTLTIPSDETWTYTFWVQTTSGNVNGSTRPDYGYIQLKVYNNATLINTLTGSSSPYGGHTATLTSSKSFTSADSSPKLILKTWALSGLNIEPVYVVMLTKVKTSTLSDSASCI